MKTSRPVASHPEADQTLQAVLEFSCYLDRLEKDLSRMSKKLRNRETAQGAGFVANGIREAQNYLTIVKRVIQKTQRAIRRNDLESGQSSLGSTSDPL